tara:strand:+ start:464 stop:1156 length:693 start_codon:yes stop_codon:yes gene_type:complete
MILRTIFLLFLLVNVSVLAQTGEITYKITHPEEMDDIDDRVKQVNFETTLMSFSLIFNQKGSFFKTNKNVPQDKYLATMAAILTKSKHAYFQNRLDNDTYYNINIANKEYVVKDSTKNKNWQLYSESKEIEGFTCYKAIKIDFNERNQTSHERVAWYSPEIPMPYGPAGYGGLPGLILEIEVRNGFVYYISEIILNKQKDLELPKLKEGPEISPKEMVILMRKARKVTED